MQWEQSGHYYPHFPPSPYVLFWGKLTLHYGIFWRTLTYPPESWFQTFLCWASVHQVSRKVSFLATFAQSWLVWVLTSPRSILRMIWHTLYQCGNILYPCPSFCIQWYFSTSDRDSYQSIQDTWYHNIILEMIILYFV